MLPNLPRGMAFQIYQAWLQGPSALFRLFEDSFGRQALYGPPDPDMQQRTIDDLSEQIGRLQARNERLQAEVGELQGHTPFCICIGTVNKPNLIHARLLDGLTSEDRLGL
jgi:hypothetical protein